MGRQSSIALGLAILLSTGAAIMLGFDVAWPSLRAGIFTTGLLVASGTAWSAWISIRNRETFHYEVVRARRDLHAGRRGRHLHSASGSDN